MSSGLKDFQYNNFSFLNMTSIKFRMKYKISWNVFNDNESMFTSQLKNFVSNDIFYWRNKTFSGLWNALCKSQKVLYELIFLHKKISLWSTKCRHIREVSFPLYHINCCFCILTFLDSHQYLIVAIKSYDLYKNEAKV